MLVTRGHKYWLLAVGWPSFTMEIVNPSWVGPKSCAFETEADGTGNLAAE